VSNYCNKPTDDARCEHISNKLGVSSECQREPGHAGDHQHWCSYCLLALLAKKPAPCQGGGG
jgi:hypothetical protein